MTGLTKNDTKAWNAALSAAAAADVIVLTLGIDGSIEGESNDRTSIDLPPVQHALAAAVGALGKPMALVLIHGGGLDTSAELASPAVRAIVDSFYPGMVGAKAIADTLFGLNDNLGCVGGENVGRGTGAMCGVALGLRGSRIALSCTAMLPITGPGLRTATAHCHFRPRWLCCPHFLFCLR